MPCHVQHARQCILVKPHEGCRLQRLKEHLSDVEHSRDTSSVYQHFKATGHRPDHENFCQIYNESYYFSRVNLETLAILLQRDKVLNLRIPVHYSIESWKKIFTKHMQSLIDVQNKLFDKKLKNRVFRG